MRPPSNLEKLTGNFFSMGMRRIKPSILKKQYNLSSEILYVCNVGQQERYNNNNNRERFTHRAITIEHNDVEHYMEHAVTRRGFNASSSLSSLFQYLFCNHSLTFLTSAGSAMTLFGLSLFYLDS